MDCLYSCILVANCFTFNFLFCFSFSCVCEYSIPLEPGFNQKHYTNIPSLLWTRGVARGQPQSEAQPTPLLLPHFEKSGYTPAVNWCHVPSNLAVRPKKITGLFALLAWKLGRSVGRSFFLFFFFKSGHRRNAAFSNWPKISENMGWLFFFFFWFSILHF